MKKFEFNNDRYTTEQLAQFDLVCIEDRYTANRLLQLGFNGCLREDGCYFFETPEFIHTLKLL